MERNFRVGPMTKPGGGLKDRPLCEMCGRPVKISSDDYERVEILCAHCAAEERVAEMHEDEPG